jgi:hypothetical protein
LAETGSITTAAQERQFHRLIRFLQTPARVQNTGIIIS